MEIRRLVRTFSRLKDACDAALIANDNAEDLQTICMQMTFEINLAKIRLDEFINREEE